MLDPALIFLFTQASCQQITRADAAKLREIFAQFATETDKKGEKVITSEDFIRKFLGLYEDDNYNRESLNLIASIVDLNKDGYISYDEFEAFEKLLCSPDALYRTAFHLFQRSGQDYITYDDFVSLMEKTVLHQKLPFDLDSNFIHLYFGQDKRRVLAYEDFGQFLHDYHDEYGLEAFRRYNKDGFIGINDFKDIMLTVKSHLVNDLVKTNIINSPTFSEGKTKISFPYYMAFNNLLNNMELFKRVYIYATGGDKNRAVNKLQFLHSANMISQVTPLEVDILFSICQTIHKGDKNVYYRYLREITPEQYYRRVKQSITEFKAVSSPDERSFFIIFLENVYRFGLGAIAGCIGAAAVYPVDLVKTRIQNQRIGPKGEKMYENYVDCFKKVVRNEGARGLYKGLPVQLCGVAPEKAIKLSFNDFFRDKMTDKQGKISFFGEYISGFGAGCCQVIITNPLEIVKIRLQVAGESAKGKSVTAFKVIKSLGLRGLYRGYRACMMRDSTFSSIYFPTYSRVKAKLADENGYNHPVTLLLSGAIAGMPAASFVTPIDVVKTRIQVIPKKGQTQYHGIRDAVTKIYQEEGFKAFWKGTLARVCRSSPQFGVTLSAYEILQRLFYIDFGGSRPAGSELRVSTPLQETSKKPHHIGGYQVAIPVLTGLETKFGISLPRFAFPKDE